MCCIDRVEEAKAREMALAETKSRTPARVETVPPVDALAMEVGYGLIPLVDVDRGLITFDEPPSC